MPEKTLFLLRHAKSSRDDPDLDDFDRPLAARGVEDAPKMGREMARRGWLPQAALVSPAARTLETWKLATAGWGAAAKPKSPEALYLAGASRLLAEIAKTPETAASLIVVGHNPGMEQLARRLAGPGSDAAALGLLAQKFPTGGLARVTFEGTWAEIGASSAVLRNFLRPRDLG